MGRKNYPFENLFTQLTRFELKKKLFTNFGRFFDSVSNWSNSIINFTIKRNWMEFSFIIIIGASFAIPAMWIMWKGINGNEKTIDKDFIKLSY